MKTENKRNYSGENDGITLIALVVTIVVLLILAGVSVNALFGDSGIIKKAQDAQNKMSEAQQNDLKGINEVEKWITENTTVPMLTFTAQDVNGKDKIYKVEKGMTWK